LRLAVRWGVARQLFKPAEQRNCEICESKESLKITRNCFWDEPGKCKKCGDIKFEDVYQDAGQSNFLCPTCNHKVRFRGEYELGKSYRTPGCPMSKLTERASFLLELVEWSDTTGNLPTASTLFEESLFFFEVRRLITSERVAAEQEMAPKEKEKKK